VTALAVVMETLGLLVLLFGRRDRLVPSLAVLLLGLGCALFWLA
jgi:hypothetical protein